MDVFLPYLVILLMVILSAFFSGTEISFNAANKLRLKKAAEAGDRRASLAHRISEDFKTALSAILIGNNLANIAASSAATIIIVGLLGREDGWASAVSTVVMTLIILIFGEIVPKIAARQNADKVVLWVALPIRILSILLYPIIALVLLLIKGLSKLWGSDVPEDAPTMTEDELSELIETCEEEGVIDEDQSDLLQSTLDFPDTTVQEILTPRIDMVSLDIDDDPETIRETIESSRFSRLPVYEDSVDNIIGILVLNHFYKALLGGGEVDIRSLLMKPCFIHKTMKLPAAMDAMRESKLHMAVVTDEFGGTMGIVTMEDILEELVGAIWDETDVVKNELNQTGEDSYDVIGDMNVEDFFDQLDVDASDFECEYTTVGGWAIEMLDSDPHVGDSFAYKNLYMVVVEMDDMRVTKLNAVVLPKEDEEE